MMNIEPQLLEQNGTVRLVSGHLSLLLNDPDLVWVVIDGQGELVATDVVDYLVNKGVPFRNAHHVIGALVAMAEEKSVPLNKLSLNDVQSVDAHFAADWVDCFDVENALKAREKTGMPGPNEVAKQIARIRSML